MVLTEKLKIDTAFLPADWKELGAQKFGCSMSKIEKVASRVRDDKKILAWLIGLAEAGKRDQEELAERLSKVAKI